MKIQKRGKTCGEYMAPWINVMGGYLVDNSTTTECSFCSISSTNQFLVAISSSYDKRWRNFGILWVFIIFNAFAAVFLYWLARVPKQTKKAKKE